MRGVHKQDMDVGKPRVTNGSHNSGDLSFGDGCLGKRRSMNKRFFTPGNVYSRCTGSSGQGMTGGHTAAHTTTRKVHFVALMDCTGDHNCALTQTTFKTPDARSWMTPRQRQTICFPLRRKSRIQLFSRMA